MTEHLGHEKHDLPEVGPGNIRNGTRSKTVLTDTTGAVEIDVPRDREGTFDPQIAKKRQRRHHPHRPRSGTFNKLDSTVWRARTTLMAAEMMP